MLGGHTYHDPLLALELKHGVLVLGRRAKLGRALGRRGRVTGGEEEKTNVSTRLAQAWPFARYLALTTDEARSSGFLCVICERSTFFRPDVTAPPWNKQINGGNKN